jgi:hypothetical protein
LAIELQCLIDLDVEIELTLEEAREADGASSGPEDSVPQYSSGPAVTRSGDLCLPGNHRLSGIVLPSPDRLVSSLAVRFYGAPLMGPRSHNPAPGHPGIPARWTSSALASARDTSHTLA